MFSIRNLHLAIPAMLAPMAGVSDLPFRLMARRFGCPLAFTEMVSARALCMDNVKTLKLLQSSPDDRPLGVQLLGREPADLREALYALERLSYDVIDLNAACPVRKVTRKGEGAALLKEPRLLGRLVATLVAHAKVPVTVKIRSGWDHASINARETAAVIADAGADAVCVHSRTRTQGYGGKADPDIIRSVKEAVAIPVIASGDLFSLEAVERVRRETGCDAVMVARGALGNPWIFGEIAAAYGRGGNPSRPSMEELTRVMEEHLRLSVERHGEYLGVIDFRKFFIWYTRGLKNGRLLRPRAVLMSTADEMKGLIDELRRVASSPSRPLPVLDPLPRETLEGPEPMPISGWVQ